MGFTGIVKNFCWIKIKIRFKVDFGCKPGILLEMMLSGVAE
jgi:hypothetical protein